MKECAFFANTNWDDVLARKVCVIIFICLLPCVLLLFTRSVNNAGLKQLLPDYPMHVSSTRLYARQRQTIQQTQSNSFFKEKRAALGTRTRGPCCMKMSIGLCSTSTRLWRPQELLHVHMYMRNPAYCLFYLPIICDPLREKGPFDVNYNFRDTCGNSQICGTFGKSPFCYR